MTHASLCKKTYKNTLGFPGSIAPSCRLFGFFILLLTIGNLLLADPHHRRLSRSPLRRHRCRPARSARLTRMRTEALCNSPPKVEVGRSTGALPLAGK